MALLAACRPSAAPAYGAHAAQLLSEQQAGEFTLLDFADTTSHQLSVPRRAAHPNAAKLLAAIITGPEGQRISAESQDQPPNG
jgi:hypothetical protein